jgi:prepilin signal peptidase PulO-like enzyme (type II secretory pathway)
VPQLTLTEYVILAAVTISAITDLKTTKIYNWITLPAAVAGLALNLWLGYGAAGASGAAWAAFWSAVGWCLGVFLTAAPKHKRGESFLKGGDAKMWGAIGACVMPLKMLICWIYFSIGYGAVSAFLIARAAQPDEFKGFWPMVETCMAAILNRPVAGDRGNIEAARKALIPIGPVIAAGTYLGIFFDKPLMQFMGLK